jgi:PAS domain S-box-containing protein
MNGAEIFVGSAGLRSSSQLRRVIVYTWVLAILWTVLIASSLGWSYRDGLRERDDIARAEARAAIGRDVLYRRWGSFHGGVYAPVSQKTPPNPYLDHIAERDISTPSGRALTLINPAYMTRQVYELAREQKNNDIGRAHLTSLKPLRPENSPDPWEARALASFEQGILETSEVQVLDGQRYMRLMRPFVTEKSCLKCHAAQGYREGDVRGGLSVSIPVTLIEQAIFKSFLGNSLAHGIIWICGLGVLVVGSRKLGGSIRTLQESEIRYRTVADFTSDWEYWRCPDGEFNYISPSCKAVSGYSPDEFFADQQLISRVIHPDDRHNFEDHLHTISDGGEPEPIDFRIITKDGKQRWISHICRRVIGPDGGDLGRRASNRDITARKAAEEEIHQQAIILEEEVAERQQAQEELQEQASLLEEEALDRQQAQESLAVKQQQLEALNASLEQTIADAVADLRHKDQILIQQGRLAAMGEMIHNIAHQWRQPLNNVGLIVQNLQLSFQDGSLSNDEIDKEISAAMNHIVHMSRTIDDFRNFFSVDKEKHGFVVNNAVSHALDFIGATLVNCNIQVDVQAAEVVTASGFQNEFAQVLLNILSNARDVLVERKIVEPIIRVAITSENGRSVVTVSDNGGGIADHVLPKIFDPYFTTKEQGKGTGIGLYMSKAIIEQNMDGRLTVRNADGGAEFRIEV